MVDYAIVLQMRDCSSGDCTWADTDVSVRVRTDTLMDAGTPIPSNGITFNFNGGTWGNFSGEMNLTVATERISL